MTPVKWKAVMSQRFCLTSRYGSGPVIVINGLVAVAVRRSSTSLSAEETKP